MYKKPLIRLLLLCCACLSIPHLTAQPRAHFNACLFNTPNNEPYLETHLTVSAASLQAVKEGFGYKNSVKVSVRILKDSQLVRSKEYNLNGPVFTDLNAPPAFIDNQRYALPEGNYVAEITLRDNLGISKKSEFMIRHEVTIDFDENAIECSSIQALERFTKTDTLGPLTKSGYDLIPYTVNYYPESSTHLSFYIETYNTNKVLGENKVFLQSYHLESAVDGKIIENYGSFKKQKSSPVVSLLARMDIQNLPGGHYNLVVEVKDAENKLHKKSIYYFHRVNRRLDVAARTAQSSKEVAADFFGNCNNLDTLKMFVECLWPIADAVDKERIVNQAIKKDAEMMKAFAVDFWQRRAADSANPVKMWSRYYQSVQEVMALFKCGKQKGYYSDRGRVFLQYGPPNQRSIQPNEHNTYPYEIWQYYRIADASNGQFYTNRKFVFVNRNIGDECYMLVHSDMTGELRNPRWQYDITRRNSQGVANPDNDTPGGTEHNQFNDIYSNPR